MKKKKQINEERELFKTFFVVVGLSVIAVLLIMLLSPSHKPTFHIYQQECHNETEWTYTKIECTNSTTLNPGDILLLGYACPISCSGNCVVRANNTGVMIKEVCEKVEVDGIRLNKTEFFNYCAKDDNLGNFNTCEDAWEWANQGFGSGYALIPKDTLDINWLNENCERLKGYTGMIIFQREVGVEIEHNDYIKGIVGFKCGDYTVEVEQ